MVRCGRTASPSLTGLFRQSVYSRLAGYEDTNDAERLAEHPAFQMARLVTPSMSTAPRAPFTARKSSRPTMATSKIPFRRGSPACARGGAVSHFRGETP
jgi:hypothetical protein